MTSNVTVQIESVIQNALLGRDVRPRIVDMEFRELITTEIGNENLCCIGKEFIQARERSLFYP